MNVQLPIDSLGAEPALVRAPQASVGAEHELKFTLDRDAYKAAQALPLLGQRAAGPAWRRVRSVYYDTASGALKAHGMVLRMRKTRGGFLMGIKWAPATGESAFERRELEVKLRAAEPNLKALDYRTATELLEITGDQPLTPVYVTDIKRSTRLVRTAGATIEVALDEGWCLAGDKREAVREIELELKSGEPAALYQLGLALVDALPVRLGVLSKAQRGALLASGAPPAPARAIAPALTAETSVDEAIGLVLRSCLTQFLGNWSAAASGDKVTAVHQMRVAMRQLRAAVDLFRRTMSCPEFALLRIEAKRIATAMGKARDWDVFLDSAKTGPLTHFGERPGFAKLVDAAEARAAAGHASVGALLGDASTTRFVLLAEQFIARRGWRNSVAGDLLPRLSEPVVGFAAQALEWLDRKVRRSGRKFEALNAEERHELRIRLKRARYATDFFGGLFAQRADVKRYARRAAALQETLGQCNDAAVTLPIVASLDLAGDSELAMAAGIVAGWSGRSSVGDEDALRATWKAFTKAERYWRADLEAPDDASASEAGKSLTD